MLSKPESYPRIRAKAYICNMTDWRWLLSQSKEVKSILHNYPEIQIVGESTLNNKERCLKNCSIMWKTIEQLKEAWLNRSIASRTAAATTTSFPAHHLTGDFARGPGFLSRERRAFRVCDMENGYCYETLRDSIASLSDSRAVLEVVAFFSVRINHCGSFDDSDFSGAMSHWFLPVSWWLSLRFKSPHFNVWIPPKFELRRTPVHVAEGSLRAFENLLQKLFFVNLLD